MRGDRSVAQLLRRAFAALVVLIVCSGFAGVATVLVQHRNVSKLTEHVLPLQLANADLRAVLADAQRGLRGYLLTGDSTLLDTYSAARRDYPRAGAAMRRLASNGENAFVTEQTTRADIWWVVAERQRQAPPRSFEAANLVAEGRPLFQAFLSANDALDASLSRRAADLQRQSSVLGVATVAALAALTVATALLATLTAVRTTRRITGPLSGVVTVLDRLRNGEHHSRADADQGPVEIRAVAGAVNTMAEEADRIRRRDEGLGSRRAAVRALGYRIRQHLIVADAVTEAVRGLPGTLQADHVMIRMLPGTPGMPALASWRDEHVAGPLEQLAACPVSWLGSGDVWAGDGRPGDGRSGDGWSGDVWAGDGWVGDQPAPPREGPPDDERRSYAAAGGGPVVTVALSNGEELLGAITVIRDEGAAGWTPDEVRLAEAVAADLGRAVHHARLYEQERHLVSRLQELDNAKTDFMSTVSHELRTPLTSIAGYVEMLRDADAGEINPAQDRMLDVISRNTRRLRALIEDLLILSKIESGAFRASREPVDLAVLVQNALAAVTPAATKASVGLHTDVRGPLRLHADPEQLDRVLVNLLSNAVKFTPAEGTVSVAGRRDGDEVVVVVADTGMGIPQPEQPALFARFFRASNAVRQAIPGTGLGLAIARTIVDNHGGQIDVQSTEGAGTAVTLRLPVQVGT